VERCVRAKNDLPIYYYTNNSLHKSCISVCIKAGNLYEKDDELGIAHFLEHIIFRNINKALNYDMKQRLDKMGAYFNGCTFNEFVEIKIIAAKKHFRECAEIISKVFEPIDVDPEHIDLERKRIKSEIREDDEKSSIDYMGRKIVWKGTNLSKCIAGNSETLDKIDGERLRKYAHETLTPDNVFIYVTGAASKEEINLLADYVGAYNLFASNEIKENMAPVPAKFFKRDAVVKIKKDDYCEVRYSFDFDSTKYSKEYIDLIYEILFDGECSKVYDELSEKTGIVYSYSSVIDIYNNIGTISFSYEVKKKHLLLSIEKIMNILYNLKLGLEDELLYVLPNYVDNAEMILDEPERLGWIMSYEAHILNYKFNSIEARMKRYSSITKEDLVSAMNEIFVKDNLVMNVKCKKKNSFSPEEIKGIVNQYL